MKIEQHYPDQKSLANAEATYKEALLILNSLYMTPPTEEAKPLSTNDVVDYYMMSCVHTIVDMLTDGVMSFPSVFNDCKRKTYVKTSKDSMQFDKFYLNADYEHTALFGAVYYVLARQKIIPREYLDYIERVFTNDEKLKGYFLPFKDAAEKKNAEEDEPKKKGQKDEVKKLTPEQAGLFCEALLTIRNCKYTNKKETIAPLASALFGWAPSTIERNGFSYTNEDRKYVAELFETLDSKFSSFVKNFGRKEAQISTTSGDSKNKKK